VKSARFDDSEGVHKWTIECGDGTKARARWFIPAIGFAAKAYIPQMEGMNDFKGIIHHTAVSLHPESLVQFFCFDVN
jgi:cation diffusion facilitator CzcD-associated flavoprotein CzcO